MNRVLPHQELCNLSNTVLRRVVEEGDKDIYRMERLLYDNMGYLKEWYVYHSDCLLPVAEATTRFGQLIALRGAIIGQMESYINSSNFVDDEFTKKEKRLLVKHMFKMPYDDAIHIQNQNYMFSVTSTTCLRFISGMYSDLGQHDWSEYFGETYKGFSRNAYKLMIVVEKGEDAYIQRGILQLEERVLNELKRQIMEGQNYDYEKIKEELEELSLKRLEA